MFIAPPWLCGWLIFCIIYSFVDLYKSPVLAGCGLLSFLCFYFLFIENQWAVAVSYGSKYSQDKIIILSDVWFWRKMQACDVTPKYFWNIFIEIHLFFDDSSHILMISWRVQQQSRFKHTHDFFEKETQTHAPACTLGHLRGLGCLCLVCLELLASLHLHGAVDNPIGSQRLQPLHFHDHHLGSADITAICCSPGVIHPATWRSKRKGENLEQTRCCQILAVFLDFIHSMPMPARVTMHTAALTSAWRTLVMIWAFPLTSNYCGCIIEHMKS